QQPDPGLELHLLLLSTADNRNKRALRLLEAHLGGDHAEAWHTQADAIGTGDVLAAVAIAVLGDGVLRVDTLETPLGVEARRVARVAAIVQALLLGTARTDQRVVPLEAGPRQLRRTRGQSQTMLVGKEDRVRNRFPAQILLRSLPV